MHGRSEDEFNGVRGDISAKAGGQGVQETVFIKAPKALSADEREAWRALQCADPRLASPYFSLEYVEAVAAVRSDVRVIVRARCGAPQAFLPVQLDPLGHARPVGGPLSDHHGVIGPVSGPAQLTDMLRRAGVGVFDFHGALGFQNAFQNRGFTVDGSWVIDLSDGYDAWRSRRKKPGGNTLRTILVSERKLSERRGNVEFRLEDDDPALFEALFAWKSEQYRQAGYFDVFSTDWTRRLLAVLMNVPEPSGARGVVSSLRVDGALAAVHFGMLGGGVLHYWFPAYAPEFQKDGAGNALLVRILQNAGVLGVREVHLGPGAYRYKASLSDWQFPLVQGFLGHGAAGLTWTLARRAESLGKTPALGPFNDLPGRVFRRIDQITGFRAA